MAAAQNMAMTTTQKIIAIAVTIIIISTVAIPIIDDLQSSIKTDGQNVDQTYTIKDSLTSSFTVYYDAPTLTVGSQTYTMTGACVVLQTNSIVFAVSNNAEHLVAIFDGSAAYVDETTITVTNDQISYGATTVDYTGYILYLSNKGEFGAFTAGDTVRFNNDSVLYAVADCAANSEFFSVAGGGSAHNITCDIIRNITQGEIVPGESGKLNLHYTSTDHGYNEFVVGTDAVTFTYFDGSSTYSSEDVTLNSIIAPLKYKYISDEDSQLSNLIGIIPILLILVPVMMAVRMMALKRN